MPIGAPRFHLAIIPDTVWKAYWIRSTGARQESVPRRYFRGSKETKTVYSLSEDLFWTLSPPIWGGREMSSFIKTEQNERHILPAVRAIAERAFTRAAGAPLIGGNRVRLLIN